jgi:2-desacetyl-2-hydroxyethyl bacteriochlorophyllide A dehydrogenase
VGDRCCIRPYLNCGECGACRRGLTNCCMKLQVLGVHRDGGMRPEFVLPARKLHASRSLSFDQLALVETLAIGCHAVDRGAPRPDESCLVVGAGPIGLATLEFVKLSGARPVVLDLNEQRLEFCRTTMGVERTIRLSESLDDDLRAATDGHGPDVVIDATGNSTSMSNAFGLIAPGGRLVYVGITTEEVRFRHPVFHKPEGTLLCSRNALPGDFARIIELIEDGRIDTRPWITHRSGFDELPGLFPSYTRPETGVIKAIVEVDA